MLPHTYAASYIYIPEAVGEEAELSIRIRMLTYAVRRYEANPPQRDGVKADARLLVTLDR
jgi:hypothetical protein